MPCCAETIIPFSHEAETFIVYGDELSIPYGPYPTVKVLYWDFDQQKYISSGVYTSVALRGSPLSQVIVRHGGQATGIIKIS